MNTNVVCPVCGKRIPDDMPPMIPCLEYCHIHGMDDPPERQFRVCSVHCSLLAKDNCQIYHQAAESNSVVIAGTASSSLPS